MTSRSDGDPQDREPSHPGSRTGASFEIPDARNLTLARLRAPGRHQPRGSGQFKPAIFNPQPRPRSSISHSPLLPDPLITSRSIPDTSSINGKWQKPKSRKYFDAIDLANDKLKVCAIAFSRLRSGERSLRYAYPR